MTVFKRNIDGDAGIMVGIGNDITAVAEITDFYIETLIATILLGIHFQGIAVSDLAILWFFMKNAALYGAIVGNGRFKRAAGNCTMIYNGH
ncbi:MULTISPECIES: hypothetical protein [Faecalibacterium]|uniref:hypothetical protein n=1 Tax=Faecalibacterium TaxID=216851 RepID=UPI0012DBDF7B|nr:MULTISPECIES: hypothetical protein [Faecalibacterium]MBO1310434.1 hypothetical protein [Faecalibacterium sp. Marseille-Q4164]MBS6772102.1 hypothetical protein [Faecalibacterium prausnitzii]MBS7104599.1 hypothetical protein [Faecalibacterium prausnitzii]